MYKALQPRHDVDRIYVSKKGGRALTSFEDNIDALIQLEECIKKSLVEDWLQLPETIDNMRIYRTKTTRKQIGKKNSCMDILSNKQATTHIRKFGSG